MRGLDDDGLVLQLDLQAADRAAVAVGGQDLLPEPGIADAVGRGGGSGSLQLQPDSLQDVLVQGLREVGGQEQVGHLPHGFGILPKGMEDFRFESRGHTPFPEDPRARVGGVQRELGPGLGSKIPDTVELQAVEGILGLVGLTRRAEVGEELLHGLLDLGEGQLPPALPLQVAKRQQDQ